MSAGRTLQGRLRQWLADTGESRYQLERRAGIPHATAAGWFHRTAPRVGNGDTLVQLATRTGLSLDYLLFGTGPVTRDGQRPPLELADDVRTYLDTALRGKGVTEQEVEEVLGEAGDDGVLVALARLVAEEVERMRRYRSPGRRLNAARRIAGRRRAD